MKKSNIILVVLLVSLWIIPTIVWGVYKISGSGDFYTGFGNDLKTVVITNPGLKVEDIKINLDPASNYPREMNRADNASYLYYKGKKQYLPDVSLQDDSLLVGNVINAPAGEKLTLHIRINGISAVMLNGETVWSR